MVVILSRPQCEMSVKYIILTGDTVNPMTFAQFMPCFVLLWFDAGQFYPYPIYTHYIQIPIDAMHICIVM